MDDLYNKIEELKNNKRVFYEYIKAFYNIEKVQDMMKDKEEFKIIQEFIKKEDDN